MSLSAIDEDCKFAVRCNGKAALPPERDAGDPARRPGDRPSLNAAAEWLDRSDPSDLTIH